MAEIAREKSRPGKQMGDKMHEERQRLLNPENWGANQLPLGVDMADYTREVVKKRWQEQGIWDDRWLHRAGDHWKHEDAPFTPSTTASEDDSEPARGLFGSSIARPKRRKKVHLAAEQRVQRERDRQASRPIHQFLWQIHKERDRPHKPALGDAALSDAAGNTCLDINSRVYEKVKSVWIDRGIWDSQWGLLPGMSWKHERPLNWSAEPDANAANYVRLDDDSIGGRDPPAQPPSLGSPMQKDEDAGPNGGPNLQVSPIPDVMRLPEINHIWHKQHTPAGGQRQSDGIEQSHEAYFPMNTDISSNANDQCRGLLDDHISQPPHRQLGHVREDIIDQPPSHLHSLPLLRRKRGRPRRCITDLITQEASSNDHGPTDLAGAKKAGNTDPFEPKSRRKAARSTFEDIRNHTDAMNGITKPTSRRSKRAREVNATENEHVSSAPTKRAKGIGGRTTQLEDADTFVSDTFKKPAGRPRQGAVNSEETSRSPKEER
ncbi:MAG: hypothetical protein Q9174_004400 [Haloplaca sp. 1 TL-2023]